MRTTPATHVSAENALPKFLHHLKQLPRAAAGDSLDGLLELWSPMAKSPSNMAPGRFILGEHRRATEAQLDFGLSVGETQTDAEVVGEMRTTHGHNAGEVWRAIPVKHESEFVPAPMSSTSTPC